MGRCCIGRCCIQRCCIATHDATAALVLNRYNLQLAADSSLSFCWSWAVAWLDSCQSATADATQQPCDRLYWPTTHHVVSQHFPQCLSQKKLPLAHQAVRGRELLLPLPPKLLLVSSQQTTTAGILLHPTAPGTTGVWETSKNASPCATCPALKSPARNTPAGSSKKGMLNLPCNEIPCQQHTISNMAYPSLAPPLTTRLQPKASSYILLLQAPVKQHKPHVQPVLHLQPLPRTHQTQHVPNPCPPPQPTAAVHQMCCLCSAYMPSCAQA